MVRGASSESPDRVGGAERSLPLSAFWSIRSMSSLPAADSEQQDVGYMSPAFRLLGRGVF